MSSKKKIEVTAPAKTNLWLRVLGKREDGFHEIESRMVNLSLQDHLTLQQTKGKKIELTCSDKSLPVGEDNLVVRAARAMESLTSKKLGLKIHLEKRIPCGAGLGGGSSDAAAVLHAVNQIGAFEIPLEDLVTAAASIGSDVPFFVHRTSCDVSGRGEIVEPVPEGKMPRLPIILIKPGFEISSAWAYQNLASSRDTNYPESVPQICPWGSMENDLERPVFIKFPILCQIKEWLLKQPEIHAAILSGSGSTVLAVLRHFDEGEPLVEKVKSYFGEETWTFCG